jgi:hypothetical protein
MRRVFPKVTGSLKTGDVESGGHGQERLQAYSPVSNL